MPVAYTEADQLTRVHPIVLFGVSMILLAPDET
jgi:hypothetical protein